MSLKNLISLGLMATILTVPAANAATLTAQVPTTKVALPTPMTDAELDEVTGEEQHFTPGGKAPLSAGSGVGAAMRNGAAVGAANAIGGGLFTSLKNDGKIDGHEAKSLAVTGGVGAASGAAGGLFSTAVKGAGLSETVSTVIEGGRTLLNSFIGAGVQDTLINGKQRKP